MNQKNVNMRHLKDWGSFNKAKDKLQDTSNEEKGHSEIEKAHYDHGSSTGGKDVMDKGMKKDTAGEPKKGSHKASDVADLSEPKKIAKPKDESTIK